MAANQLIRQGFPLPPITIAEESRGLIRFHHPLYTVRTSTFLWLPKVDVITDGANNPRAGVYHHTALVACQLIANNTFDGRLYLDREGQDAVQVALDDVLLDDDYFFIANPDDPEWEYPIVPSFRDWQFPHLDFPPSWPLPSGTDEVSRCVLTRSSMGLKSAHLVPKAEPLWADRETMTAYGVEPARDTTAQASRNVSKNNVFLRADIHKCFDNSRSFAIVPKGGMGGVGGGGGVANPPPRYVVHCLGLRDIMEEEFCSLYHNVPLQGIRHLSKEALLARFAWAIFPGVQRFLLQGPTRAIIQCDAGGGQKFERMDSDKLRELYGGRDATGSASPERKRRRVYSLGTDGTWDYEGSDVESETGEEWGQYVRQ